MASITLSHRASRPAFSGPGRVTPAPVSYTHLDVYKRQLLIIFGLVKLVLAMIQKHREERCSHGKKEI